VLNSYFFIFYLRGAEQGVEGKTQTKEIEIRNKALLDYLLKILF